MIKKKIVALLSCLTILISSASVFAEKNEYSEEFDVFRQVAGYIATYYIDDTLDDYDIMNGAISDYVAGNDGRLVMLLKSMLQALDPYSEFFTAEEYQGFVNNINKSFYGIGVRIEQEEDYVVVAGFTAGSPAEEAGVKVGDKIFKVNGEDMVGANTTHVRNAIAGELGTDVQVTFLRDGKEVDITITRGEVNEDTVFYKKLSDTVAYISIIDMAERTGDEFEEALKSADDDKITNIVLDLRNNGGGFLSSAVDVCEQIIPKGVIVDTIYRQSFMNHTYHSELEECKYKFNVLVNEYTASAAEILASAIQDSGVGILIGETTYGKGVIQNAFPLANGSVFKLTVGHYITRNGHEINGVGLSPDEEVKNETQNIDTSVYTPFTYSQKWFEGSVDDNVKAAEERLSALGYYNGEIDGEYDKDLVLAIMNFQRDADLYSYGVLDITTQTKLENAFAKIEIIIDKQLDMAVELFK